jgi:hypothetical protein
MLILEIMLVLGLAIVTFAWIGMICVLVRFLFDDFMDKNFGMVIVELLGIGLWLICSVGIIYQVIK